MKKMYYLAILLILATTLLFLIFYCDENITCIKYLKNYGYESENSPETCEMYLIPREFDASLMDYNLIQLSQGFDLSTHKGENALKYTYKITNCTNLGYPLYANFILSGGKIVAADLTNPQIDGFILPVIHISDLIKNHTPAKNDAVIP